MSADSGRSKASQVCITCKARKKKCDKAMPHCGYCTRKNLRCSFMPVSKTERTKHQDSHPSSLDLFSSQSFHEPAIGDANLYNRVLQIIHETGQFIDDLTARYFHGPHCYLPIVSRSRFQSNLITLGAIPSAGFSILLLTICLTASSISKQRRCSHHTVPARDRALYLATKSLLARVQSSGPGCLSLIQSRLLLALYDYAHGRPEDAFDSIAGCARMAYAARLHLNCRAGVTRETHIDLDAQREEADTWWGIVMCERVFFCEVGYQEQPLITTIRTAATLPSGMGDQRDDGSSEPDWSTSAIAETNMRGFDRSVQAARLLDEVLKSFENSDLEARIFQLQNLDNKIQAFLTEVMRQCYSQNITTEFCLTINITIRTLLKLHAHILELLDLRLGSQDQDMKRLYERSQAALDTLTQMVLDIIETYHTPAPDVIPPTFSYMTRAALRYVRGQKHWQAENQHNAVERMRQSLQ